MLTFHFHWCLSFKQGDSVVIWGRQPQAYLIYILYHIPEKALKAPGHELESRTPPSLCEICFLKMAVCLPRVMWYFSMGDQRYHKLSFCRWTNFQDENDEEFSIVLWSGIQKKGRLYGGLRKSSSDEFWYGVSRQSSLSGDCLSFTFLREGIYFIRLSRSHLLRLSATSYWISAQSGTYFA